MSENSDLKYFKWNKEFSNNVEKQILDLNLQ